MRIMIDNSELEDVFETLMKIKSNYKSSDFMGEKDLESINLLLRRISEKASSQVSIKQKNAAKKATKARTEKAKQKIENTVNLLQLRNIEVTTYTVSLNSGCSFNTCKKYKHYWEK